MAESSTPTTELPFDPNALRDKYRLERDKRLRAEGNNQYLEIAGDFARYSEDPYAQPLTREPITDEMEVTIIGGGFGGLLPWRAAPGSRRAGPANH